MRSFCEFVIVDCSEMGLTLNEATLQSLTLAGAAAYLLRQSSVVKQRIQQAKNARFIEDKLDNLGDAIEALSSKMTAGSAISWAVAKRL